MGGSASSVITCAETWACHAKVTLEIAGRPTSRTKRAPGNSGSRNGPGHQCQPAMRGDQPKGQLCTERLVPDVQHQVGASARGTRDVGEDTGGLPVVDDEVLVRPVRQIDFGAGRPRCRGQHGDEFVLMDQDRAVARLGDRAAHDHEVEPYGVESLRETFRMTLVEFPDEVGATGPHRLHRGGQRVDGHGLDRAQDDPPALARAEVDDPRGRVVPKRSRACASRHMKASVSPALSPSSCRANSSSSQPTTPRVRTGNPAPSKPVS